MNELFSTITAPKPKEVSLNQGQKAAAEGFFEFLFSDDRELIISGAGGVGKTFLMGYLIDRIMPHYINTCRLTGMEPVYTSVQMTATTNKAAEVLGLATGRPTSTIHSFLNLQPRDDYQTGQTRLVPTANWRVHNGLILFVDECSMIDSQLRKFILEGTQGCKIVYVGDHCQLAPVMETLSPIYKQEPPLPFFRLTEPMRNAGQPALMAVCQQLRETVETGVFKPIQIVPGVIDHADDEEMRALIAQYFAQQTREHRILAYTNQRVQLYNDYIRELRRLPPEFTKGELLVNNQAVTLRRKLLSVEVEVEVVDVADTTHLVHLSDYHGQPVQMEVRRCSLRSTLGESFPDVEVPVNWQYYVDLMKFYKREKNWNRFFYLKNNYPDLRPRDAATIHKAQGSTYDTVFVDLGNLSTCHNPDMAARLLYVAFTRARNRIVLYGNLAAKYGGLAA